MLLLVAEWLPISVFIHTRRGGQSAARGIVAFASIFLTFAWLRNRDAIIGLSSQVKEFGLSGRYLILHCCAMLMFLALSLASAGGSYPAAAIPRAFAWYAAGTCGVVSAAFMFLPARIWRSLAGSTGNLWMVALAGAAAAWKLVSVSWFVWNTPSLRPVADVTFRLVEWLLRPFIANLIVDRTGLAIGSPRFEIAVGDACSGLEGAGLILVFSVAWLWMFRREVRFPRALLLIPAGVGAMFALNAVRIAALVLIGNAGAPGVAIGGFHSQAGWIAFNVVALGCSFAIPHITWFRAHDATWHDAPSERNPSVPYLLPFASILAAGMVSRAVSARFEWLYPLRFVAAAAVIWICRRAYRELKWKPGWLAPFAGSLVFLMWIALDRGSHADNGIAAGLASLPPLARTGWLFFRVLAAVVTVPVAEELAFRGFFLRWLVNSNFELVDFRRFTWFALLTSSVLFGLMHGQHWLAGTLAGLIYAAMMLRRGSIGDAVVAHATTNFLLAAWVLIEGNWQLW